MEDTSRTLKHLLSENLGLVLQMLAISTIIYSGISIWAETTNNIVEIQKWRASIEVSEKEKKLEHSRNIETINSKFSITETDIRNMKSVVDKLDYRVSTTESNVAEINKLIKDIQLSLNTQNLLMTTQSSELKFIRELLENKRRKDK